MVAAVTLIGGVLASRLGREGWAFASVAVAIVTATGSLFTALFPDVLRSSVARLHADHRQRLVDGQDARADDRGRVHLPAVRAAYQAWTYWVFRKRVSVPGGTTGTPAVPPVPAGTGSSDSVSLIGPDPAEPETAGR